MTPRTAVAAAAAALLAACCLAATASAAMAAASPTVVELAITDDGCQVPVTTLAAGPVTFQVRNAGASRVAELELLSGQRVLGEVENIGIEGLSGKFTLELAAGRYTLWCPHGKKTEKVQLTVTAARGSSAAASAAATARVAARAKAIAAYRTYIEAQSKQLVAATARWVAAIRKGDLAEARRLYGPTRVFYERIEPVAESFGTIDPEVDAREGDVPARGWGGFHRIEKQLWVEKAPAAAILPVALALQSDIARLDRLVDGAAYQVAQIANGAKELMDEIGASKVTGEEDRYAHTDLWDFKANVDGARAVYAALKPLLLPANATLAARIERELARTEAALAAHRKGDGWAIYTTVTPAQRKVLARAVDSLAEPLSQLAAAVVR